MSSFDTNAGAGRSGFSTGTSGVNTITSSVPPGAGRSGFDTTSGAVPPGAGRSGFSTVNPDDVEGLKKSVAEAVPKERNRPRERTPNAALNNAGKYPLRTVQEYIGGHRTVIDNTPGARIVETAHGAGTFQQWSEDGSEIKVVVGNAHHHMKEGYTLTINQNGDIKIDGHCRVSVGGGVHLEVKGDVSLVSSGKIMAFTPKDYNIVAGGKVNILGRGGVNISTDSSFKVRAVADQTYKIGGNTIEEIKGNVETTIGGDVTEDVGGSVDATIGGNVTEDVSGNVTENIGGAAIEEVAGAKIARSASSIEDISGAKLSQAGTMKFEAGRIDLN